MKKQINLAIMGTGRIAGQICPTLNQLKCLKVYAVASRNLEKAQKFASDFFIEKAYGSYEKMLEDPDVDLVYIATPHSEHLKYISLCARHKKNIICEKSFTINASEAIKAFEICKQNNVFITEAIWCRFTPMAKEIKKVLDSGILGKIIHVSTNLCYNTYHRERTHLNNLGGGSLLDVGIYCLNFLDLVIGSDIEEILHVSTEIDPEYKTDKQDEVLIKYKNGTTGSFYCSSLTCSDRTGMIYGQNGYAVVQNINNYESIKIYDNSRTGLPIKEIVAPKFITGYEYEFEESCKKISEGKKESDCAPYEQTVKLMKQMDLIRKKINLVYPNDISVV